MSEHVKRLREWIRVVAGASATIAEKDLDATLSAARDAALEEARARMEQLERECEGHSPTSASAFASAGDAIDALKSRPAERYIPEAKVVGWARRLYTEVRARGDWTVAEAIADICAEMAPGVDLDAK